MRSTLMPALVMAGALCAGCGSGAPSDGGGGSHAATTSGPSAQEKRVKFAECLRGNGVPHFPDPDAKGDFAFGVDVSREVWLRANEACKRLKPPGTFSSKRTAKEQSASLRFARCVRDNGVEDFPDPVNGEPLIDTYKIPSSNRPGGMTILNAATKQCGELLKRAAEGQR